MPNGSTFVIQERDNLSTDGGKRFEWKASEQSSPRNSWDYGIKLRTVREDYVGSTVPSEQVLGWNFENFDLSGVWDDRYNYQGFAEKMREDMEALIQRGNLCEISFENIKVVGLITNLKINYKRDIYIGYTFTVSPHYRDEGAQTVKVKEKPTMRDYTQQIRQQVEELRKKNLAAPSPFIAGQLYENVKNQVAVIIDLSEKSQNILEQRAIHIATDPTAPVSPASRLSTIFVSLQKAAQTLPPFLAAMTADADPTTGALAYEAAIPVLGYEVWARELCANARFIALLAYLAAQDLQRRIEPDALAIYRPYKGESFYAISNRFYGTPHKWRIIAQRNRIEAFTLNGDELLIIPNPNTVK